MTQAASATISSTQRKHRASAASIRFHEIDGLLPEVRELAATTATTWTSTSSG